MIAQGGDSHFLGIVVAFGVFTILAIVIERILNFIFDLPLARRQFSKSATWRDWKPAISLGFCLALCFGFSADIFAFLLPGSDVYAPSSEQIAAIAKAKAAIAAAEKNSAGQYVAELELAWALRKSATVPGMFLTALLLAGGSAGMMSLFQETLGMSKSAREAQRRLRAAELRRAALEKADTSRRGFKVPQPKEGGKAGFSL